MRVFVTGASGFIGSAVVKELLTAGHEVTGLVRSGEAAASLEAKGVQAYRGTFEDTSILRRAAADADGVVHTAFYHALSQASLDIRLRILFGGSPAKIVNRFINEAVDAECRAIQAFGGVLSSKKGSLVIAFPTMALKPGRVAEEGDAADPASVGGARAKSERALLEWVKAGVNASIVRLPPSVHDENKQGLVTQLIEIARKKRVSVYVSDGENRWPAVHKLDAARMFRFALEAGKPGTRYHAVAEEGIPFREIAEALGRGLNIPVMSVPTQQAARYFGWLAPFVTADNPVSSGITQEDMQWEPEHPCLMLDLATKMQLSG
ncbi:3-beta hydroxysteroid dehydrogenase (plasmid) [Pantoea cypripedii]|uniref:3-beta hydroxysteroid dehydrogenase n=2 Tax=Pantoea cypripedii TaxID=55209 RepID=A0A6B9G6C2_PANCY|nr:3-beta hydroxysteroid dehydrogenase [Pantoea cypripedii]